MQECFNPHEIYIIFYFLALNVSTNYGALIIYFVSSPG